MSNETQFADVTDGKRHTPRRRWMRAVIGGLLGIGVGVIVVLMLQGRLYANTGISLDKRLFWLSPGPIGPKDYVTFVLDHPLLPHSARVVKQVRCVPGQWLRVDDEAAWCDGKRLGPKKRFTRDGRPMPVFRYDGRIPAHKYFVMNPHKDSFDSRYYGLRDEHELKRLKVLF